MNEIQDRIMGEPEVLQVSNMSASAIRRAIERGEFPRQIKLSARAKGWRASDIQRWLAGLEFLGPKDAGNECASNGVAHDLSTNSRMVGE